MYSVWLSEFLQFFSILDLFAYAQHRERSIICCVISLRFTFIKYTRLTVSNYINQIIISYWRTCRLPGIELHDVITHNYIHKGFYRDESSLAIISRPPIMYIGTLNSRTMCLIKKIVIGLKQNIRAWRKLRTI